MNRLSYVVITPVRDEAAYVGRTIESMAQQTILPQKWIIVDDGSTDKTPYIIDSASKKYPWLHAVHRSDRGCRKSGGGVVEAFYDGYSAIGAISWDFIVKLDGDLSFEPDYFEKSLSQFLAEPLLGIAGGTVYVFDKGVLKNDLEGGPSFHVRGATKIYRRECWEKISPLIKAPGWDTIDEVKANMHGWTTRTFRELKLIQHKATGSMDGNWGNWYKNGIGSYNTGYHPIFMMARCVKCAFSKPFFVASIALMAGFFSGYRNKRPQLIGDQTIRYLRKQQIRKFLLRKSIYR